MVGDESGSMVAIGGGVVVVGVRGWVSLRGAGGGSNLKSMNHLSPMPIFFFF